MQHTKKTQKRSLLFSDPLMRSANCTPQSLIGYDGSGASEARGLLSGHGRRKVRAIRKRVIGQKCVQFWAVYAGRRPFLVTL